MHNRILNGTAYSTRGVTIDAFKRVVERAGTSDLPDIKRALDKLQQDMQKLSK